MQLNYGLLRKPMKRFPRSGTTPKLSLQCGIRGLLLLACLCCLCSAAGGQISPGPLAKAHESLNGPGNCTKCHSVSTKSPAFRCTECHTEIAAELQQHKGLHATYPQTGPPGAACVKCHSDHNGVDFSLLHWDPTPKGFDHSKTGYTLDGKHVGVTCRSCHQASHVAAPWRPLLVSKDVNTTWLGMPTDCIGCHKDEHQGRFGTNCAQCHSTADWKNTRLDTQNFDHSKTQYPLTGLHKQVACEKCHTAGPDGKPRYKGIAFIVCNECHVDPHKGEFRQQACDSCHTTAGWKATTFVSNFDHSKTHYPLLGKHLQVGCLTCHKSGDFKTPIPHDKCADCHKPDPHSGQFAKRADGGACESCHTVAGWAPSLYTVADHAKTGFPLVAPHATVKCASCHIPAGTATKFRLKYAMCVDCHEDVHKGQFAGEPWHNHCEQCHTGGTFKTSTMTLAKHQQTNFPLTGGHVAVACDDCHKPMGASTVPVYHFRPLSCTSCHEDIHKGQFTSRMVLLDASHKPLGCEACHSTNEWKDLARFDHARTKFPLLGAHRSVACIDCHRPPNMERTMIHVQFAGASTSCKDCHENPHADQFSTRGDDCASCHNSNKWRPSLFDHEKTAFSLKGAHQDVACAACHTTKKPVDGKLVLFYKPTPTACSACHGDKFPQGK
jgi:predicted CXXCH cytochrome family protein